MTTDALTTPNELAFSFLRSNRRPAKPRTRGVTEIRGPYYSVMGPRYLQDVLDTMGEHVDSLKFAGGSFTLMPERALREIIQIAHDHGVLVSTGGFIEHVLTRGPDTGDRYIDEVARLGFDILEISAGFISIPTDDILRLVERVQHAGLKAKPEVGIQFGAGGATAPEELEQEGTRDVGFAIDLARRCLDAGAYMIMIESEGISEEVIGWRTDVVAAIARELGLEKVMFEAADPEVFGWYIKNYGPEVNLFVDHSQIVQLECLRSGIWGTKSLGDASSPTRANEGGSDGDRSAHQADLRAARPRRRSPRADRPRLGARRHTRARVSMSGPASWRPATSCAAGSRTTPPASRSSAPAIAVSWMPSASASPSSAAVRRRDRSRSSTPRAIESTTTPSSSRSYWVMPEGPARERPAGPVVPIQRHAHVLRTDREDGGRGHGGARKEEWKRDN